MTRLELTRTVLLTIAGFSPLRARELVASDKLKDDLEISNAQLSYLATALTDVVRVVVPKKWIPATVLRTKDYRVSDVILLMMEKCFDTTLGSQEIRDLITRARSEL